MADNNYKWKRQKRGRTYIPPLLSDKDEFVPDTHIGMYQLVTNPKDPAIYMAELQCQKMRKETFDAVATLYKKYGSPDFQIFWNYNLEAINELGLNKFTTHTRLLPIVGIMECFEKKMKLKSNGSMRYVISFGVEKKKLSDYLREVKFSKKTGKEVPPPRLELKHPNKSRDLILFGETILKTEGGNLVIDKNAVYNQFSHWCSLNGVTKKTGATMALKFFVENHKIDGLGDVEDYDILTELDRPVLAAKRKTENIDETIKVRIDGNLLAKAKDIVKKYNRDVANIAKETLTMAGYINNAIHLLNEHMPLKYRDPELYEQKRQLELLEQQTGYNPEEDETDGFEFDEEEWGEDNAEEES